jgi:transcriptional regulator with XRE-family HTH domain
MSYFGRNIRKIRAAKNISQSTFADLFKLTRASIGAYEEGRAEAKVDTIIEIADYFQLTLDQFLKKELTINDIYHIAEKSKKIEQIDQQNKHETEVPLVKLSEYNEFVQNMHKLQFVKALQTIKLPGLIKKSMAFEYSETIQTSINSGLRNGDILIAQNISPNDIEKIFKNQIYIVIFNTDLFLGQLDTNLHGKLSFSENAIQIDDVSVKAIWSVYQIISSKMPFSDQIEIRLQNIENQLKKLIE